MKRKLECVADLWLCWYGNQDSVLLSAAKIAHDRIGRAYEMNVHLKGSINALKNYNPYSKLCPFHNRLSIICLLISMGTQTFLMFHVLNSDMHLSLI